MDGGSNYSKMWLQSSLNRGAVARAAEAIEIMGEGLPCRVTAISGSIVTVAFEVDQPPWSLSTVTIPKAESNWIRSPTQVGDKGVAVPGGAFLGAISGFGGGTATLALQGNLSNLYFLPIASTAFTPPPDQNKALIQGPAGVVAQTSDGNVVLTLSASGLTLTIGGVAVATFTTQTISLQAGNIELN